MKIRHRKPLAFCAALALPVLALPIVAAAAQAPASAVQNCSRAFAASLGTHLAGDRYVPSAPSIDPYAVYAPSHQLELTARSRADRHVVAHAICTYDSSGVVNLRRDPLDFNAGLLTSVE